MDLKLDNSVDSLKAQMKCFCEPQRARMLKYPIINHDLELHAIEMPQSARIAHVHAQENRPTMWAIVDSDRGTSSVLVERLFAVVATGRSIPNDAVYLGTVHLDDGQLVYHIFEIKR